EHGTRRMPGRVARRGPRSEESALAMPPAADSTVSTPSTPSARTVLITGASSGIGRMTAELIASRGWRWAATARAPSTLSEWAAASGPHVATFRLDVTDEASIAAAVADIVQRFGG